MSISEKKDPQNINFVKSNISFIVLSINLNKGSVALRIWSKSSIAKKFENHWHSGYSVRFAVGRPGVHFLRRVTQKLFKNGIYIFST